MRRSWLKGQTGRTLLVHLKDADSIEGILMGVYEDGIAFRHARMLKAGGQATEMAGEPFVPWAQLVIAQHGE